MLGEYVRGAYRRERTRNSYPAFKYVRKPLVPLYAIAATILAGPIIVLLVLLLPAQYIPIKQLRDWAGRLPRALSASLGDVYVILATHVDRASIRARIVRDHAWLRERCETTVIVAHSAGSALTHQLIRDGRVRDVEVYVTFGEAIWRMHWMAQLSRSGAKRLWALGLALGGFGLWAAAIAALFVDDPPLSAPCLLLASAALHGRRRGSSGAGPKPIRRARRPSTCCSAARRACGPGVTSSDHRTRCPPAP